MLLHDPAVLLLDEPLSGLDPRARIEMRNVLRRLGQLGKTIMISSHILPELADICNKVGIIDRGVMGVSATVADVMKQVRDKTILHVGVKGDVDRAISILESMPIVESVLKGDGHLVVSLKQTEADYSSIPTALVQGGLSLTMFREEELNLETAFMTLTRGVGSKI